MSKLTPLFRGSYAIIDFADDPDERLAGGRHRFRLTIGPAEMTRVESLL